MVLMDKVVQLLQFNPVYFTNEFGNPRFVLHLNISFSLSNKHADLKKNSVDPRLFFFILKVLLNKTKISLEQDEKLTK